MLQCVAVFLSTIAIPHFIIEYAIIYLIIVLKINICVVSSFQLLKIILL